MLPSIWELASEKLHCADFTHNPPKFAAVTKTLNGGDGQKSRHTLKITLFMVIVIPWFSYSFLRRKNQNVTSAVIIGWAEVVRVTRGHLQWFRAPVKIWNFLFPLLYKQNCHCFGTTKLTSVPACENVTNATSRIIIALCVVMHAMLMRDRA